MRIPKFPVKVIIMAIVSIVLNLAFAHTSHAAGGFSVTPVFPENQNPESNGFFDLRLEAGAEHVFYVIVQATGDEDAVVEINLTTATTNVNGIIEYSPREGYEIGPLSQIASVPPQFREFTIPSGYYTHVPITVNVPVGGFHGVILGSVHVRQVLSDEDIAAAGTIAHRFAHVIPVLMRENDEPVYVDFTLGEVNAELISGIAHIIVDIHHPNPRITRNTLIAASIYPEGSDSPIFAISNLNVEFAPESTFPMTFRDTGGYGIVAGNYRVVVRMERQGRTWEFEQNFVIEVEEAEAINLGAINIEQMPMQPTQIGAPMGDGSSAMPPWLPIVIAASVVTVLGVAGMVAVVLVKNQKVRLAELETRRALARERLEAMQASLLSD